MDMSMSSINNISKHSFEELEKNEGLPQMVDMHSAYKAPEIS
jgi:hypothetical protein